MTYCRINEIKDYSEYSDYELLLSCYFYGLRLGVAARGQLPETLGYEGRFAVRV